ncbi:hypothetical protein RASY3_14405 [Ruminococcus albus SY3]|uniref:Uncharacterized protein n=1 Tax=Ruminococcus albus SY3 TaxID=1341156 RepID=A0A011UD49_RUMAL|nr:hypothetical protein [Ruminococcus albus]EXM38519.1 hypothetical protein RASY3_14405 [Ruminococcus albus SY3]
MSKANNTNTTDNTNTTATELTALPDFASALARLSENTGTVSVVLDIKSQKALIEENAPDNWDEFKAYLASVNYCLTPTKRILCDVGGMTAADYTRLTGYLDTMRYTLTDWVSCQRRLDTPNIPKAKKKEIAVLCENAQRSVYAALKGIKVLLGINIKATPSDCQWLASRCITVKYRDRTNIKLGYTLSVVGSMTILSNIFKLVSAQADAQTALENAQAALIKRKGEGIKTAIAEITALPDSTDSAQ